VDGTPLNTTPEEYYRKTIRAEENRVWRTFPFTSEETWFWERIQGDTEQTRSYPILLEHPEISTNQAILRGSILAVKSFESAGPDHYVRIYINNQEAVIAELKWDGKSRIHFELPFPMSHLSPGNNTIRLVVIPTVTIPQVDVFIDWFEIEYDCDYRVSEDRIQIETISGTNREFLVRDFSSPDLLVLDVQNERDPMIVSGWQTQAGTSPGLVNVRFHGSSSIYTITSQSAIEKPGEISLYTSPNYLDEVGVDYAFVTSKDLLPATMQFASYRESSGYHTAVVDFQDLVNDFNFGIYHPIAIKNYFRYLLEKQGQLPTYALLVGDGHWNFQNSSNYSTAENQIPPNLAWVDPWQGEVDSANLLATIIGDDPLADLMIARLPVNTEAEVVEYLDKLKTFDQSKPGNWHNNHLFITDNPDDAGNFYNYANQVISTYIDPEPGMAPVRIFLEDDPIYTNQAILDFLNKTGAQIVNYVGHGRINGWAAETILENSDIDRMNNPKTPPIFISMTCLDGYWIHPNQPSLIEELVRSKYGAVAAFSPTGLGVSTGHDIMHQAMYRAILHDRVETLGEAAEAAKLALFQANSDLDLLQTYTIFGDPSLRFRFDWKIYIPGIFKGS
jgi:hypothetical protein